MSDEGCGNCSVLKERHAEAGCGNWSEPAMKFDLETLCSLCGRPYGHHAAGSDLCPALTGQVFIPVKEIRLSDVRRAVRNVFGITVEHLMEIEESSAKSTTDTGFGGKQ